MAYGQNFTNVGLDIAAIGLAGAGAITVPLQSAQTLAALAGIATASRASTNADIFAQNASPVISQKISITYMPEIKAFLGQTGNVTEQNLNSSYGQSLATHADCTLNAALAAIGNNMGATTSRIVLTKDALQPGAVLVDPTLQTWYKVFTYIKDEPTAGIVTEKIVVPFHAGAQETEQVDRFLTQLNSNGGFVLKAGS